MYLTTPFSIKINLIKNLFITICLVLVASCLYAQQLPLTESYFVDKYSLSSAYAGNSENKSLFVNYRRDWSGVSTGPRTLRLSYHDELGLNAGLGGKIILDKFGVFQSFYGMATYSYRIRLVENQFLFFGFSAGMHQNSINFSDFYNDPNFTSDPSMINKDVKSTVRLISDFSVIYSTGKFQSGLLFSNVSYSDFKYTDVQVRYSPFVHYQLHANYTIPFSGAWEFNPIAIYRGGKNIQGQLEVASQFKYSNRVWGNIAHRGKNVFCLGFGMNASKGLLLNYTYNFFTGVTVAGFQNHELTIGLKLADFFPKNDDSVNEN